ncbi:MAG: hypothetical protein ACF8CQ_18065 [Rhodopirellula sp. JB044]|uniref:hypothetical protein n=1 Tax=Rhodopirellula sp. JB044 TaxID=3342844 RepID=UPI00370AE601
MKRKGSLAVVAMVLSVSLIPIAGCGDSSTPELNSTRSELEAFLEEHPNGLSEDVKMEGQE